MKISPESPRFSSSSRSSAHVNRRMLETSETVNDCSKIIESQRALSHKPLKVHRHPPSIAGKTDLVATRSLHLANKRQYPGEATHKKRHRS